MQCDICGKKKATVHLTEIVDEQISEMHLCEDCAKEKSSQMEQQFGLADLLAGLADFGKQVKGTEKTSIKCEQCGMSYDDFRKFGRLGCNLCYEAFKSQLSTLLKKIHGSNQHYGKSPMRIPESERRKIGTLQDLKLRLQNAIQIEDFELAANLRDQIRAMETKSKDTHEA